MTTTLNVERRYVFRVVCNGMDSLNHLDDLSQADADRFIDNMYDRIGNIVQNAYNAGILNDNDLRSLNILEGILPTMWA